MNVQLSNYAETAHGVVLGCVFHKLGEHSSFNTQFVILIWIWLTQDTRFAALCVALQNRSVTYFPSQTPLS